VSEVSHVDHLVGLDEDITEICEALQYDGSRKTAIVHGLGGMGKTQLALAYAQRHKEEYSAVFWINSKDANTLTLYSQRMLYFYTLHTEPEAFDVLLN
jgi:DNA replication protein DnaC